MAPYQDLSQVRCLYRHLTCSSCGGPTGEHLSNVNAGYYLYSADHTEKAGIIANLAKT